MLYDLAIKNIKQDYLLHSIHIVITALAVLVYFDFLLMSADTKLMRLFDEVLPAGEILTVFSVAVAILLVAFTIYWDRLLLKQRYQDIGLLELMGGKSFKILAALSIEILISEIVAFSIGILLGLLFYKLLAMILLKISFFHIEISFFYANGPLLWTLALILILQVLLFLNNFITVKRFSLIRLLKKNHPKPYRPVPSTRAYFVGILVVLLFVLVIFMIQHVFRITYELSWLLHMPEEPSFLIAFLIIALLWIIAMYGFFRVLLPLTFKILSKFKRLYFSDIHMFTFSELRSWFTQNYRSLAIMSLLMGVAFSLLSVGAMLSRYGMASVDSYTPYSILTTEKKRAAVRSELEEKRIPFHALPGIQGTIVPVSYRLETVLGDDYISTANPGMAITTKTYNQFARQRGIAPIHLKAHEAVLILPVTSIIQDKQYQETGKHPRIKVGEYANLNLNIRKLSNHFPLGQTLAFDIAVVVNPGDYDKLTEGIQEVYYAFELPHELTDTQLSRFEKLDHRQYYHMSGSYLMKYGRGNKQAINVFMHPQIFLRQIQQRDMQTAIGLLMFTGVFVSLIFIIAIAEILMLKRLTVAQDLQNDYQTLLKIGVRPQKLKQTIVLTQGFIYLLLLVLGFWQSLMVSDVLGVFINRPNLYLLYLITGVFTLIYALIYSLTTVLYIRIVHI